MAARRRRASRVAPSAASSAQARRFGASDVADQARRAGAVVFPGEILVPVAPAGVRRVRPLGARQAEIADRDRARAAGVAATIAIGEGVELLDVAEGVAGLPFHPGAQTRLQRAALDLEGARRQREAVVDRHHLRPPVGDRDQHGDQLDGDRRRPPPDGPLFDRPRHRRFLRAPPASRV